MSNLKLVISEIRARIERKQRDVPKLIQPSRGHLREIADISLLLRIVEIQQKALEEIKSDECRKHSCHECDHCGADMNDLKHLARQAIAEVDALINNEGRKE